MRSLPSRAARCLALACGLALAACLAPLAQAQAPTQGPGPSGPNVLSRENMVVVGSLTSGSSANYTVNYQPMTEGGGNPAPWLLRMYFSAPGASPNTMGFNWFDQTNPSAQGATAGNNGNSVAPNYGGNATDIPAGTDSSVIQQAVLSGASSGTFAITVFNNSTVSASYTLRLFPLVGGVLEPGLNPNPTPIPQATATPVPAPVAPPTPTPVPFAPFWVKTLINSAQLWSNTTTPPGVSFGGLRQFSCLQVMAPQTSARLNVMNPATKNFAYVNASEVGALAPNDRSCG